MYNPFVIHYSRRDGTMSASQQLERANELVQAGQYEDAQQLLEQIIKEDRHDIPAWRLYTETWPKPKDKIRIWELCLRHNPGNAEAEQALASLGAKQAGKIKIKPDRESHPGRSGSKRSSQWLLWGSMSLLAVVAVFAVLAVRNASPKDPAEYRHSQPVEYYLYVPKAYSSDQEWPLFVGVHGSGGTGLDCWNLWQGYAEKEGFILLCPSIPGDANGYRLDVGENVVWSAIREVQKEYRIKTRMFFSGFSAGAMFVQGFMYHYPDYVSGLSVMSSGIYFKPEMFAQLVPMLVVIGDADDQQAVQASQLFVDGLKSNGFDVEYKVLPGVGHTVTREGVLATIELFRKSMGN
jgi:phospholipase/carboxylesterase